MPPTGCPRPAWGRIPRPAFGADYNPEQWDPATWRQDVALMREARVNLVSLGIFGWSWIEPEPGHHDFTGLDEVLGLLHGAGIRVDLATPTAAPPLWFSHAHPESLPVTAEGQRLAPGSRQAFCPSSPAYRERAAAITRTLAERYGEHPAVVMWHVNNEYGNTNAACYCDTSAAAFRDWLRRTGGEDLEGLNSRWGTAFWGMRFSDWRQVRPPSASTGSLPPGLLLDFRRFCDAEQLACYRAERDIVRAHSPGRPVTTNLMTGNFGAADYWRWAREVDLVANDHYLTAEDPHRAAELAFAADLTRGLAGGRPWLLMEHSTSAVQWQPRNLAKEPGEMARNTFTHLARGADGTLFFQWRQSAYGAEKWHSAMLPHGGRDTRVWREAAALGAAVARLDALPGSTCPPADTALVWDYDAWWALELPDRPSTDMTYRPELRAWHRALWSAGLPCDIVPPPSGVAPATPEDAQPAPGDARAEPDDARAAPDGATAPDSTRAAADSGTSPAPGNARAEPDDAHAAPGGDLPAPGGPTTRGNARAAAGSGRAVDGEAGAGTLGGPAAGAGAWPASARGRAGVGVAGRRRLLLVPSLYAVTAGTAAALAAYAQGGGHVVVGAFSGVADLDDRLHPGHHPGGLRDLLGLHVDEYLPLAAGQRVTLEDGSACHTWAERVVPGPDARVDAVFTDGPAAGGPALLHRDLGRGTVRYVATRLDDAALRRHLPRWAAAAGCAAPLPGSGDGVEVTRRTSPGPDPASWLFAVNHTAAEAELPARGVEVLTGSRADGLLRVAPGTVAVLRED